MTIPFSSPEQQGDDEELLEHRDTEHEAQPGEHETGEEHDADKMQLPPEAQGTTNGGPLGCCLGVTMGLLLSLVVVILSRLYADPLAQVFHGNLSMIVRLVMTIFAIGGAIVFGYLGWKIGKRVYREYELSPGQQQRLAQLETKYQRRQAQKTSHGNR